MKVLRIISGHSSDSTGRIEQLAIALESSQAGVKATVRATDLSENELSIALAENNADIAIHYPGHLDHGNLLSSAGIAVPFRGNQRSMAVFSNDILTKIADGKEIRIINSAENDLMAKSFLEKALPHGGELLNIRFLKVDETINEQLLKLQDNSVDGLILPADIIDSLLTTDLQLQKWWTTARWMMLPLIECVPTAAQGAILVEANPADNDVVNLVNTINDDKLLNDCRNEWMIALRFNKEGVQELGVTTIYYRNQPAYYAAGIDKEGNAFEEWTGLPTLDATDKKLFSATDFMKSFFSYTDIELPKEIPAPIAFVANYKAVQINGVSDLLKEKKIWASGTRTWFELAKAGYWVWGSADALGLEFLQPLFATKSVNIRKEDICIVTHDDAAARWQQKGWKAAGTYGLAPKSNPAVEEQIKDADIVFWTSYNQYELYKDRLKKDVIHSCASGETASLLQAQGLNPVIFPNIKAFTAWRKSVSP